MDLFSRPDLVQDLVVPAVPHVNTETMPKPAPVIRKRKEPEPGEYAGYGNPTKYRLVATSKHICKANARHVWSESTNCDPTGAPKPCPECGSPMFRHTWAKRMTLCP